jgi:LytR cell envelope-related transcriptional attenuator
VKTRDERWRWLWEDEDPLEEDVLGELVGEEGQRPSTLVPPPQVTTEDVWAWIASDEDLIDRDVLDIESSPQAPPSEAPPSEAPPSEAPPSEYPPPPPGVTSWVELLKFQITPESQPPEPSESASRAEEPRSADASATHAPPAPAAEEPRSAHVSGSATTTVEEPVEAEPRREPRLMWGRRGRFLALLAVVAVVGTVAPRVFPAVLPGAGPRSSGAPPPEQTVVAWTIRLEGTPEATFVTVLAAGVRPPVAVAVPADVTINVPGQGLGTVGEAAAGGDSGLVEVALENLTGVPIDASIGSQGTDLQAGIDALGTIEVADDQLLNGEQVVQYLTTLGPAALPDEPFLRWQDVLDGILRAVAVHPEAVSAFPEALRPVLLASSPEPADLYALPVIDLGAGLVRPDQKALDRFVKEHFLPPATAEVRLVVLNGVGTPGLGEEVARILVPQGYRLMSSANANTFDVKTTKVIASSGDDLASAQQARDLLGVGQVFLGFSRLADVTIVVGRDFVASHHLGGA